MHCIVEPGKWSLSTIVRCSRWCLFIWRSVCLGTPCLLLRSVKVLYVGQQIFRRIHIRLMDCSQITSSKRGIHKKNVWTSDKSWEPGRFFMFSYVFQCFLTFSNVTYSHSHSHSLSHYLTLSLFLTLTLFQSLIESLLTCWTTFVFISMLKSHSHTLTLSLSHTLSLSLSHSFNLSFNHSRHAEQVLFSCLGSKVAVYSRKLQWFFLDLLSLSVPWVLSS